MTAGLLLYRCRKCGRIDSDLRVTNPEGSLLDSIIDNHGGPTLPNARPMQRVHACVPRSDLGPAVYGVADLVGAVEGREVTP